MYSFVYALIALFKVSFSYLHYNIIKHVCEAISGYFVVLTRNCLASTLDYIVMQTRRSVSVHWVACGTCSVPGIFFKSGIIRCGHTHHGKCHFPW